MKETPSITQQTKFKVGFFNFGKADMPHVCYFNCGLVARPDGDWLIVRRSVFEKSIRVGRNDVVAFKLEDWLPSVGYKVKFTKTFEGEHFEDPRAIFHGGRTWIGCCNFVWSREGWSGAHQMLQSVSQRWESVQRYDPVYGKNGPGIGQNTGHEKNWLWFFHDGEAHLVYEAKPHTVVKFSHDFRARDEYKTENKFPWRWGQIRGGTPPVLVDGEYWTFFHSSTPWKDPMRQYHMGAYAFQSQPPFAITRMVRKPILSGSPLDRFGNGKPPCVFPCGSLNRDGTWFITGGCNDLCCFWMKMPHKDLVDLTQPKGIVTRALEAFV